jgi:F-type H+-transporting ATPase subunit c
MTQIDSYTWVTVITVISSAAGIAIGVLGPAIAEGIAVMKALEGMARQPEAIRDIRTTLLISLAIIESLAIYVLLVVLILLFANPLIGRFFKV